MSSLRKSNRHNPAGAVDAPMTFLASSLRLRRRATDQQRSAVSIL